MVYTTKFSIKTYGKTEIVDITPHVFQAIQESGVLDGTVTVFTPGSTAAVTTIEYEPGLIKDLQATFEALFPEGKVYAHNRGAGDDNGHAHLRAALTGPSVTVPIVKGQMTLGTWQQIVLCDFDTRSRLRKLIFQIIGE